MVAACGWRIFLVALTDPSAKRHGRLVLVAMSVQEALEVDSALTGAECLDFDTIYAQHFDFVWRNLRRLGVHESGLRDAAQEVFMVVHRRLGEFVPRGSLRSWLYSILRRVAAAQRRQRYRGGSLALGDEAEQVADSSLPNPERHAARGQALRQLLMLLERLDEEKRDVLVLVDLEGMSVPEACLTLDVNANTLYSRLRAARQQMRQKFAQCNLDDWRQP